MSYPKTLLTLFILLVSLTSFAQNKKKKDMYEEYWKEQEQLEKFEAKSKEAHKLFQAGELKLALTEYEEALVLNPEDQKTIAKIRDIKILLEKKITPEPMVVVHAPEPEPEPKVELNVETEAELKSIVEENNIELDTLEQSAVIEEETPNLIAKDTLTVIKPTEKSEVKPKEEAGILKKPTQVPAPTPKSTSTDKPYKNTENYRKYLATLYIEGWTEEKYKEGNKDIIKRVHVVGDHGVEYMQVTHHYGAVYYFKNGISISYGDWVGETKEIK